jgi:hypothetical protein
MKPTRKFPLLRIILGGLLLLMGLGLVWRISISSINRRHIDAITARGEPASLADLNKFYKAVPNESNAALVWLSGVAALTNRIADIAGALTLRRGTPLREDWLEEAAEALAANQKALALFHRAATLDQNRYPVNFAQKPLTNLDHLAPVKSAAQVLRAEAAVAVARTNAALAAESINCIFAAGSSMTQEPLLISQLVAYAINALGMQTLQFALNATAIKEPSLLSIQTALAKCEDPEGAARGLIGERAFFIDGLSDPAGFSASHAIAPPSGLEEIASEVLLQPLARVSGFWQRDFQFGIDALTTQISWARLPDPQRIHAATNAAAISVRAKKGYYILSGSVLPAMEKFIARDVQHRAQLRTALVAVAIERFRLANNGKLPDQLSSLVPAFLDKVPIDPFDGQPLRFKRTDKGYVVYSIGPDEVDDGGIEAPAGLKPRSLWDVTFIVERPE